MHGGNNRLHAESGFSLLLAGVGSGGSSPTLRFKLLRLTSRSGCWREQQSARVESC